MNRSGLKTSVALAVLLLAGCGKDPGLHPQLDSPVLKPGGGAPVTALQPDSVTIDSLTFERIAGTLAPGSGGAMGRYLKTWDKNCWFALIVPPTSVDPEGGPIDFEMLIPTKATYLAHPELAERLIIRMEPDGTNFLGPITIQGTWMPWEGVPPDTVYYYSGGDWGVAQVTQPSANRYRLTFNVHHFSDWQLGPEPRDH